MDLIVALLVVALIVLSRSVLSLRDRVARLEERIEGGDHAAPVVTEPLPDPVPEPVRRRSAVILRDAPELEQAAPPPPPAQEVEPPVVAFAAVPEPAVETKRGIGIGFEDLFGRKLPIWAGGITLAVAGVLLVKYSIDAGLLSPAVRIAFGLLFGAGLIAGAEAALRAEDKVGDARVRQALAGAGIASLYAAIVAAANLYHLVGPVAAFVGLAGVTLLAMGLSLRFGAPSALLGLVGGLAAPALVGEGPPNVPLLSAYLALAIGGLTALSRQQRWMWLGVSALIGGAGWGGLLILTGAMDWATSLSLGLLVLLLGVGLPLLAFTGARAALFRSVAAIVAAAQIALLVAKGGFAPLEWGFYLLLSGLLIWLAWREERFRPLPPVGLAVGLLLAALWPEPGAGLFAAVILALAVIHVGPALLRLWRPGGGMIEAGQIVAVALAGHAIAWLHYPAMGDGWLALLALLAALLPVAGAALGWRGEAQREDGRFVTLVVAAALLIGEAAYCALPLWLLPVAVAALASGLVLLGRAAADRRVEQAALAFIGAGVVLLLATDPALDEAARLAGETGQAAMGQALLRWAAVAGAAMVGAWRLAPPHRVGVEALAALLAYGAVAQVVPGWSLPVIAALGLLGVLEGGRRLIDRVPYAAGLALGGVSLLWAAAPLAWWIGPALASVVGEPMLVGNVPVPVDAVTRLAVSAAIWLFALWRVGVPGVGLLRGAAGAAMLIAVHCLYKQLFHLDDAAEVVRLGLAERTVWEGLLLGAAFLLWRRGGLAFPVAVAALLHGLWYSIILFNPLLEEVAVGPWPVANLLIPAFAAPFGALWLIGRTAPVGKAVIVRGADILRMILILIFAFASLRQLFCGSLLVGTPIGAAENIGWSVLAIALAIGFLLWGIRSGRHDWRIGSLVLMLAAVAKVFLLDAAGLEGLLRIASFLALGFSLIGIGWLYSRFLRREVS